MLGVNPLSRVTKRAEFPNLVQTTHVGFDKDLLAELETVPPLCFWYKLTVALTLLGDVKHPILIGSPQILRTFDERCKPIDN